MSKETRSLALSPPQQAANFRSVPAPTDAFPSRPLGSSDQGDKSEDTTPRPKLKPLHWDKVQASSDRVMGDPVNAPAKEATRRLVLPTPRAENKVLDPKKAQNIAILLRALNVSKKEVCDALCEDSIADKGLTILPEAESDWRSHAAAVAQSVKLIKKRLKESMKDLADMRRSAKEKDFQS
ncbi:hypothetical protein ZEAMMB73_Zm00001d043092 [Zea mays]|uniref:Uncharacterized protein n=1 Tax=Zea mays TaxID=4577 RepID=A0A1D6N8L0_MAIZE|nr:hypothetical protein ZEAMMB73_Zm00001d043092 [Zea mays]